MSDAAEPVGACGLQRFQHRLDARAQIEVGVSHDRGCRACRAIQSAFARRSEPLHEFHLPHRPHLLGACRPVHGARLDEHRRAHVVAAVHVVGQLIQQITLIWYPSRAKVPEVVMRIADRKVRFQRLLLRQRKPVISSKRHSRASVSQGFINGSVTIPRSAAGRVGLGTGCGRGPVPPLLPRVRFRLPQVKPGTRMGRLHGVGGRLPLPKLPAQHRRARICPQPKRGNFAKE